MADPYIFNLSDAWNNVATVFKAIRMVVTDTASAAGSLLIELVVGSTTMFSVDKNGVVTVSHSDNTEERMSFPAGSGGGATRWGFVARTDRGFMLNANDGFVLILHSTAGDHTGGCVINQNYQFSFSEDATSQPNAGWKRSANGVVSPTDGTIAGWGGIGYGEVSAAPTAIANNAIVYAEDNGLGKTRLMVKFGTGAAIPLATEV